MNNPLRFAGVLLAAALLGALPTHAAEAPYPSRPVRLIVTYVPGGGVDFVARAIAAKLTEQWRQQVVVDNRGGGGGVLGTEIAARAAPDGYTLLVGTSAGLIANPLLRSKLPYDAFRDFVPITFLTITTQLLVVNPALPVHSVKDLIAHAKANPAKLSYGSAGIGAPNHLGMELFKWMTGTDLVHVPYKGSGLSIPDLLAGRIQVMLNPAAPFLPHVNAGRVRALAVGNDKRATILPNLPTVAEAGVPGFYNAPWNALYAPAKTSPAIVARLNAEIARVLRDEGFAQYLTANGAEPRASSPAELVTFMRRENDQLRKVITAAGITAE